MKVILIENIETLGTAGTVKDVANGYARNYLLPRGMAVPATAEALNRLERQRAAIERRAAAAADEARGMADRLGATTVYIYAKSGEQSRLYGSVTTADIASALAEQHGLTIDRRNISLDEPIHRLGNYTANVKLTGGTVGKVNVTVDNEANRGKPRPAATTAAPAEPTTAEATTAEATAEAAPVAEANTVEVAPVAEASPAEEAAPAAEALNTIDDTAASDAGESSAAAAATTPEEPTAPVTEVQEAAEQGETGLEADAS
jgi:large subunit ribosomal protein L9